MKVSFHSAYPWEQEQKHSSRKTAENCWKISPPFWSSYLITSYYQLFKPACFVGTSWCRVSFKSLNFINKYSIILQKYFNMYFQVNKFGKMFITAKFRTFYNALKGVNVQFHWKLEINVSRLKLNWTKRTYVICKL